MKKSFVLVLAYAFLSVGCSAMAVVQTSDPYLKLKQADQLERAGRHLPAERLAKEALDIFQMEEDNTGLAHTHLFLGQFYKSNKGRGWPDRVKQSDYYIEAKNTSILHHKKSIDAFETIADLYGVAMAKFGLANSYFEIDSHEQCKFYSDSLETFRQAELDGETEMTYPIYPNFKNFEEMVLAFDFEFCTAHKL